MFLSWNTLGDLEETSQQKKQDSLQVMVMC